LLTQERQSRQKWFNDELRKRFQYVHDNDLARRRIKTLTELMTPCKAYGFAKVRLGNKHDGATFVVDDFQDISAALSFGIRNDVT
jgi:hypothetical protein